MGKRAKKSWELNVKMTANWFTRPKRDEESSGKTKASTTIDLGINNTNERRKLRRGKCLSNVKKNNVSPTENERSTSFSRVRSNERWFNWTIFKTESIFFVGKKVRKREIELQKPDVFIFQVKFDEWKRHISLEMDKFPFIIRN